MYDKTLVKDAHGRHYTILKYVSPQIQAQLSPKEFLDQQHAHRFLQDLDVPTGYWQGLLSEVSSYASPIMNEFELEGAVSEVIASGQLKVFAVSLPASDSSPEKRTITTSEAHYAFIKPEAQLLSDGEALHFQNEAEAQALLDKINPDEKKLRSIATELNIPVAANSSSAEISKAIANSLAKGESVILHDLRASASPEIMEEVVAGAAAAEEAGLGPEDQKQEEQKEEQPCTFTKYTVECSHGRKVELDPDKQEEAKVKRMELVSMSDRVDKDKQETVTITLDLQSPCCAHEKEQVNVNQDLASYVGETYGQEVVVRTPSKYLDFKENHFRYVWLPSVKPYKYRITPSVNYCDATKFKGKGRSVPVYVYPEMKWEWSTTINFGSLEFVPGESEVKYKDFKIGADSNVVLTYDGEKIDAKEQYEKYIKKPMEGFKKVCDTVSKVLEVINDPKAALMRIGSNAVSAKPKDGSDNKDGNASRLLVDWPNLNIKYTSKLEESDRPEFVDHDFSLKIEAKPLLDIDIQVDVLDSMISVAPSPVAELMRYAKKRIEEEFEDDQKVGIRGELDIIFTVKSTININEAELKGKHNVAASESEVKPIKGDIKIPAKLKGAVKAEGKWFIISFNVHYKMKGETEWSGEFEFGNDKKGIYFSNTVEFKGVDVTLTKYEEVKAEVESDKKVNDGFFDDAGFSAESDSGSAEVKMEDGKVKGEATAKVEEERRWSWLKPKEDKKKDNPPKYYIVKR
ncbi:MAG: hypothetical protein OEY52_08510 [Gammaproteobacteria bacterium]|nr:hypothetical protein [Gammaproteobacteria bacterium]